MRKLFTSILALCVMFSSAQTKIEVSVDPSSLTEVSPYIFGHNLEHTRAAINTGLSAQMLQNRKFAGKPSKNRGVASKWFGIGERTFFTLSSVDCYTKHICLEKMPRINEFGNQSVANMTEGAEAGIGQYGLMLSAGCKYSLRTVTKADAPVTLKVQLTNRSGDKVYASKEIQLNVSKEWHVDSLELTPDSNDPDGAVRYVFTNRGEVDFGALSMMPSDNFYGMRKDVVRDLKAIGPTVLRWPGGNFAGEYRWKDGLLPSDQRAPLQAAMEIETQPYSDGYDFHELSTDDFIRLCREVGAEPFITINPVWGTPEESAQWVEYCNGAPNTEYGKIRAERGFVEPFGVKFWSLGNEMGYGHMEGALTPELYATLAEKHADAMLAVTPDLKLFSSGPYPNENWAAGAAAKLAGKSDYVSLHIYCGPSAYGGNRFHYTTPEGIEKTYTSIVESSENVYKHAVTQRKYLDATGKKLYISFDEWNQWYSWYRPSCVAEGIYTAKVLHMFLKESTSLDIPFCCYFQPVGEGAIIIEPGRSYLAANGQMFSVMKEHCRGMLCQLEGDTDRSVVVTLKDDIYTVTIINDSYDTVKDFAISLKGKLVKADQYTSSEVVPYTRFEQSEASVKSTAGKFTISMQPHSVAIMKIKK